MAGCALVLPAGATIAPAAAGAPSVRGTATTVGRVIEFRPLRADAIDPSRLLTRPDGVTRLDGGPVACRPAIPSILYRPAGREAAATLSQDVTSRKSRFGAERVLSLPMPPAHSAPDFILDHEATRECSVCHTRDRCATCHVNAGTLAGAQLVPPAGPGLDLPRWTAEYPLPPSHTTDEWLWQHGSAASSPTDCATCHTHSTCTTAWMLRHGRRRARASNRAPAATVRPTACAVTRSWARSASARTVLTSMRRPRAAAMRSSAARATSGTRSAPAVARRRSRTATAKPCRRRHAGGVHRHPTGV